MLDLNDYFSPVSIERHGFENLTGNAGFPHNIVINTENNRINVKMAKNESPLKHLSKLIIYNPPF